MANADEKTAALVDAVWHVLDDMRAGTRCCTANKAMLRRAFEPFRDADEAMEGIMTYEEACRICEEIGS